MLISVVLSELGCEAGCSARDPKAPRMKDRRTCFSFPDSLQKSERAKCQRYWDVVNRSNGTHLHIRDRLEGVGTRALEQRSFVGSLLHTGFKSPLSHALVKSDKGVGVDGAELSCT